MKSDEIKQMKPNETICFYCGNIIDRLKSKKRLFCSYECRTKYWKGVYKKLWKEGDMIVMSHDKPIQKLNNRRLKK